MTQDLPEQPGVTGKDAQKISLNVAEEIAEQPGVVNNDDSCSWQPPVTGEKNKKKKGAPFGLLKAALIKLRQNPGEATMSASPSVESLADSALPDSPASSMVSGGSLSQNVSTNNLQELANGKDDSLINGTMSRYVSTNNLQELVGTPDSPLSCYEFADGTMTRYGSMNNLQELVGTPDGTLSRYASAINLQDLDKETDPDRVFDEASGDEFIDAKADAFIAQFYQEINLQKSKKKSRHHQQRR